jgi:hypothetical protein
MKLNLDIVGIQEGRLRRIHTEFYWGSFVENVHLDDREGNLRITFRQILGKNVWSEVGEGPSQMGGGGGGFTDTQCS